MTNSQNGWLSVERTALVKELEAVSPGLATKAEYEQCDCFVFSDGKVRTFNEEVRCEYDTCLTDFNMAVKAKLLVDLLNKIPDDKLKLRLEKSRLNIRGKNKTAGLACVEEIYLNYADAGEPSAWSPLDENFIEGLSHVVECASDDQSKYTYTCVRVTPKCVEATDSWQAGRFIVPTPIGEPIYIRKDAVRSIIESGMQEISVVGQWAHFRSSDGLVLSTQISTDEDFPSLTEHLKVEGNKASFPEVLAEAAERAQLLCEDEDQFLDVLLEPGKVTVSSSSDAGWFREVNPLKDYKESPLKFKMSSELLTKVAKKYSVLKVGKNRMGVRVGQFRYIAALVLE